MFLSSWENILVFNNLLDCRSISASPISSIILHVYLYLLLSCSRREIKFVFCYLPEKGGWTSQYSLHKLSTFKILNKLGYVVNSASSLQTFIWIFDLSNEFFFGIICCIKIKLIWKFYISFLGHSLHIPSYIFSYLCWHYLYSWNYGNGYMILPCELTTSTKMLLTYFH